MSSSATRISSIGTVSTFMKVGACSETLINVLDRAYGHPMLIEEHATAPLAGGINQYGYQCGQIWGASLAAGAESYRRYGAGNKAEIRALLATQKLVESFRTRNHHMNCYEITHVNKSSTTAQMISYFLLKGGTISCFRMAAQYASVAFDEINRSFEDQQVENCSGPVSCTAILAQKAGLSDLHQTMAAGLAGGIGLSGGACGVLGAAIWIAGIEKGKQGLKIDFKAQWVTDLIGNFLKGADYKMECPEITSRLFSSISDHADFLQAGGCSKVIDAAVAAIRNC